ncbi:hypothetical protein [Yoonia sp.]|uniref:hypothetical protein n=1 Tax=Yoonia sp. TaxID=2212373 RepID=UPI0040473990
MAKLSVEQALLRADGHVRKGEHDSARALCETVLATFPKNAREAASCSIGCCGNRVEHQSSAPK